MVIRWLLGGRSGDSKYQSAFLSQAFISESPLLPSVFVAPVYLASSQINLISGACSLDGLLSTNISPL
jgi:hypothetical protein